MKSALQRLDQDELASLFNAATKLYAQSEYGSSNRLKWGEWRDHCKRKMYSLNTQRLNAQRGGGGEKDEEGGDADGGAGGGEGDDAEGKGDDGGGGGGDEVDGATNPKPKAFTFTFTAPQKLEKELIVGPFTDGKGNRWGLLIRSPPNEWFETWLQVWEHSKLEKHWGVHINTFTIAVQHKGADRSKDLIKKEKYVPQPKSYSISQGSQRVSN